MLGGSCNGNSHGKRPGPFFFGTSIGEYFDDEIMTTAMQQSTAQQHIASNNKIMLS